MFLVRIRLPSFVNAYGLWCLKLRCVKEVGTARNVSFRYKYYRYGETEALSYCNIKKNLLLQDDCTARIIIPSLQSGFIVSAVESVQMESTVTNAIQAEWDALSVFYDLENICFEDFVECDERHCSRRIN